MINRMARLYSGRHKYDLPLTWTELVRFALFCVLGQGWPHRNRLELPKGYEKVSESDIPQAEYYLSDLLLPDSV